MGRSAFQYQISMPVRRMKESMPTKSTQESHKNPVLKILTKGFWKKAKSKKKLIARAHCWSLLRVSELSLEAIKETEENIISLLSHLIYSECPAPQITYNSNVFSTTRSQKVFFHRAGRYYVLLHPEIAEFKGSLRFAFLMVSLSQMSHDSYEGKQKLAKVKYSGKSDKSHINPIFKGKIKYALQVISTKLFPLPLKYDFGDILFPHFHNMAQPISTPLCPF